MFDGQLVIDTELRTNDPSIFAAGSITKYCRRFYLEAWQHIYFNSIEIGEKVSRPKRPCTIHKYCGLLATNFSFMILRVLMKVNISKQTNMQVTVTFSS